MIKISFENVNYRVTVKSSREERNAGEPAEKNLHILKDCTGFCLPGQLTFIMGASGAGKTSLLNALSDRIATRPGMELTGKI